MILGVDYDFGFSLLYFLKNLSKEKWIKNSSKQLRTDAEFPPKYHHPVCISKEIVFGLYFNNK